VAVTLPLVLSDLAWAQSRHDELGELFGLVITSLLTFLLAVMVHHIGKRKEPVLAEFWGGEPTVRALRHRGASAEEALGELHRRLERTILGLRMPTPREEEADPRAADQVYRRVAAFLHERARIGGSLVHAELRRYRLRRNLWSLKPLGMGIAILGVLVAIALLALKRVSRDGSSSSMAAVVAVSSLALLLGWSFWVTQDWVRLSAEEYAERILTFSEEL
jgi:hypothetical protein